MLVVFDNSSVYTSIEGTINVIVSTTPLPPITPLPAIVVEAYAPIAKITIKPALNGHFTLDSSQSWTKNLGVIVTSKWFYKKLNAGDKVCNVPTFPLPPLASPTIPKYPPLRAKFAKPLPGQPVIPTFAIEELVGPNGPLQSRYTLPGNYNVYLEFSDNAFLINGTLSPNVSIAYVNVTK